MGDAKFRQRNLAFGPADRTAAEQAGLRRHGVLRKRAGHDHQACEMGCGLLLRTEAVCPKAAAVAHRKQRAKIVVFMRLILSGGNCLIV